MSAATNLLINGVIFICHHHHHCYTTVINTTIVTCTNDSFMISTNCRERWQGNSGVTTAPLYNYVNIHKLHINKENVDWVLSGVPRVCTKARRMSHCPVGPVTWRESRPWEKKKRQGWSRRGVRSWGVKAASRQARRMVRPGSVTWCGHGHPVISLGHTNEACLRVSQSMMLAHCGTQNIHVSSV